MMKLGAGKIVKISKWASPDSSISEIASMKPVSCGVGQKLSEVIPLFAKKFRRIPVTDGDGYVRGMLTTTDVLRVLGGWGRYSRKKPEERPDIIVSDAMTKHVLHLDKNTSLETSLAYFKQHRRGGYPVVYRKKLVGMVAEHDIIRQVKGNTGIKVSDVMVRKPLVAMEKHTVLDVAKMLAMGGFRRLPVTRGNVLLGVVTPMDVVRFLLEQNNLDGLESQTQSVKAIMQSNVFTTKPGYDIRDAVKTMIDNRVGGLPVTEKKDLLGIITERDIVDIIGF